MLARASFNYLTGANYAISHAGLFRALGRVPYGALHKVSVGLAWLETWVRWPLRTLRLLDGVDETFSVLDPDGRRLGLTKEVRARFRRYLLYYHVPDLLTLLTWLETSRLRQGALVVENEDVLFRERERGPGAIVAGFRIGMDALLPWALASLGSRITMIVVDTGLAELGRRVGEAYSPSSSERIRFVSAQDPRVLARCLGDLNAGGLVCTLLELSPIQYEKTTEVQFLGWKIPVPYGISYLAAATRRSIVPAILAREPGPRFRLRFGEALPAPARDRESIRDSTQQLYSALEEQVLQFPEQWTGWMLLPFHKGIELRPAPSARAPSQF